MSKKRILILSNGPVPVPEQTTVEGGGLRCWGLAMGLRANNTDLDITVAYEDSYKKESFTANYQGINIATWTIHSVTDLISTFDTIIVSYCMGDLSGIVSKNVTPQQQLILDCYVPIYVEVSARESENIREEYDAFVSDVSKWSTVLQRGDIYLCASEEQKKFYKGVLAAVGRVNPVTYGDDTILIVPYGVYRENPTQRNHPIQKMLGEKKDTVFKILWFGGIYPWFDIRALADAVKDLNAYTQAKLIVVGAKNPFNKHPDFIARYDQFVNHVKNSKLEDYVFIQEWVDFNDRADWYMDADIVVVFNKIGEENKLAWRTRLVDFMWADLPVLTNGGDPLGEQMIEGGAAIRVANTSKTELVKTMRFVSENQDTLSGIKNNMHKLKSKYYWDIVTSGLAEAIGSHRQAKDKEDRHVFLGEEGVRQHAANEAGLSATMRKIKKVPAYAKKHGTKAVALAITELAKRKLASKSIITYRTNPAYVFVSHQLDNSGAPYIIMDMAVEFKAAQKPVEFYTYLPAAKENLERLRKNHINPRVLLKKEMIPTIHDGDTVILNTFAHSEPTKETLFHAAEQGKIKLFWYLHEDHPDILFRQDEKVRIKKLLTTERLRIFIAAAKTRQNFINYFETTKNISLLPYRHVVPQKYHRPDFGPDNFDDQLRFILPGTVGDGRKGQLPIFYAFAVFYQQYYLKSPEKYRDFRLVYVGLDKDFLSRQLRAHGELLDGKVVYHEKVSWEANLDLVSDCNVTICYSLSECLPLFVFEGMIAGHVLLRNDCSGMEEQLQNGENGFFLDSNDFSQVVNTIESILNKQKTPSDMLAAMSKKSYQIAKKQEGSSYLKKVEKYE